MPGSEHARDRCRRIGLAALVVVGCGLGLTALVGETLPPAVGQTAGPVATRPAPVVAGPQNGGVALAPAVSNAAPPVALGGADAPASGGSSAGRSTDAPPPPPPAPASGGERPPSPDAPAPTPAGRAGSPSGQGSGAPAAPAVLSPLAGSAAGQGSAPALPAPDPLNLTPADGVSLLAGQALVVVAPGSASCRATATLAYSGDQAVFAAACGDGLPLRLTQPATLCLQPSAPLLAQARGNLANLGLAAPAVQPLASQPSASGILICAAVPGPGTYRLAVTGSALPPAPLHRLPPGTTVGLPAVGLGGVVPAGGP